MAVTTEVAAGPGGLRRLVMGLLAVLLLIGNLHVVLQPGPWLNASWNVWPRSRVLRDMFLLPGMFNSYSTLNLDIYIGGRRTQSGDPADAGSWVRLDVGEHLPHRLGVNFTRLWAMHHRDMWGQAGQQRAWAELAARIRDNHNRLHPRRPVDLIRFGMLRWPKSPQGYRARKQAAELRNETLYADPESP